MNEFDKYIIETIENTQTTENLNRTYRAKSLKYSKIQSRIQSIRRELKRLIKTPVKEIKQIDNEKYEKIKTLEKEKNKLITSRSNTPSKDISKKEIKITYTRYADDWIILTNLKKEKLQEIKIKINKWLNENLKLSLSEEKTIITDITKEKAKFLGFTIKNNQEKANTTTYI
jgi:hypothetical protein